jgi:regulator of protease activity HflC (stomatin/prohibitin superfamily)
MDIGFEIFVLAVVVLVIVVIALGVRTVPQGYKYTVERFGRYSRTLGPGLGIIIPFIDVIGQKVLVMEQVLDVPSQEAFTKDNAGVRIDAVAFFQVLDAARASYEVSDVKQAMLMLTMTNIRTVVGSMDLDELLSNRDTINDKLLSILDSAAAPWGAKVTRVEIKDILPPADLATAMARQMKAERDRRAAILEAEGTRNSDILRAEGRKQAAILEAEGRKESAFRDAEARERAAEAEARANALISEAISKGDMAAANYLVAEKYIGALEQLATAPNQKVLIIPVELSAVAGTLGGIAEIAKGVFGPEAVQQRRASGLPPAGE